MGNSEEKPRQELLDLIYKDELTEIYNRRYFNSQFPELCEKAVKDGEPFSFLMIDVDHFKGFNDTYGHEKGDEVLVLVSRTMKKVCADRAIPVRYAGDEFIVLMPGVPRDEGLEIAEEIRKEVADIEITIEGSDDVLRITLSVGLASYPHDTDDPTQLQHLADEAAYISKKKGRDRVSTLDEKAPETLDFTTLYRYFPCRKIIGREEVLKRTIPLMAPGAAKKRPICMFHGMPGAGKSRVLEELRKEADTQRCFIINTSGSSFTVGQPFVELLGAVSSILKENLELISQIASSMDSIKIQLLKPFLPVLSKYSVTPADISNMGPRQRKEALLDGLKEVILGIAREKTLLVFFDEFQFSNMGTQLVLERVKKDKDSGNVAIFASLCDAELSRTADSNLLRFIDKLQKEEHLDKISIKPLGKKNIIDMIEHIIKGLGEYKQVVNFVERLSGGNPGKIEEILKKLVFKNLIAIEDGKLKVQEFDEEELEGELGSILTSEVIDDSDVRSLLSKASVMGNQFSLDVLKKIDDRTESHIYGILEKAKRADLVTTRMVGDEEVFEFRRAEIKDEFYSELDEKQKKKIHQDVGKAEQELYKENASQILSELAYHFEKAGDHKKALEYLKQLASNFEGLFSREQVEVYVGELPSIEDWGTEKKLDPEEEVEALRTCRRIMIAQNNLDRFPPFSEIVRGSLDAAYLKISKMLNKVGILSFSDADGVLLINNEHPSSIESENFKEQDFLEILGRVNLKGISFRNGLSRREFLDLLQIITIYSLDRIQSEGGWEELLKKKDIENVRVNQRVFVTMSARDFMDSSRLRGKRKKVREPIKKKPTPQLPTDAAHLQNALENLRERYSDDEQMMEFLNQIQQTMGMLAKQKEQFQKAASKRENSVKKDEESAGQQGKISLGTNEKVHRQVQKAVSKFEMLMMDKINEDTDVLLEQLTYRDSEVVKIAGSALLAKGKSVVEPLFKFLVNCSNVRARKTGLAILKKLDPDVGSKFLKALMGNTNARQKENILKILKDFPGVPVDEASEILIRDDDPRVRRAFLSLYEKKASPEHVNTLIQNLNDEDENVVTDVAYSLAKIGDERAIPHLAKLVKKKWLIFNEGKSIIQEAACKALGQLGGEQALKALEEVLTRRPLIFLKRNKPASVRAAAAYALGYFEEEQVQDILKKAEKDPSPVVRSAVKLARHMLSVEKKSQTG